MRAPPTRAASRRFALAPLAAAVAAAALPAQAFTYTVTNTNTSGTGSFSDAVILANTNCSADATPTINFAITGTPPFVIATEIPQFNCPSPVAPYRPFIDGYSQPGSSQNTIAGGFNANIRIWLDGTSQVASACGINATTSARPTVRGLKIINYPLGGVCAAAVQLEGNIIEANGPAGGVSLGTLPGGTSVVGGASIAQRNVIGANAGSGVEIINGGSLTVQNNFIGTDITGNGSNLNGFDGVHVQQSGSIVISNNVISGNDQAGVRIDLQTGATVSNNKIGVGISGASVSNGGDGINVFSSSGVVMSQNGVHGNGGRGINLGFAGTTLPNDLMDGDTGANGWQNYPDITNVDHVAGETYVAFYFNSTPGRSFLLEFFANPAAGSYEGLTYLGSTTVNTDANGDQDVTMFEVVGTYTNISATARDVSTNGTSEYSQAVPFTGTPDVTVAPTSLNFGNVAINTVSGTRTSTLTSSGTGFWIIGQIGRSFPSPTCYGGPICYGGTDFMCSTTCSTGTPGYAPGNGCTLSAIFAPQSLGPQTETVGFCDNTAATLQEITLTGTGVVPPELSLLPSFYDFGPVTVNSTSAPANFVIRNSGVLPVTVNAYRTSGPFVFSNTSCDNPILPGTSCQAQVFFNPVATGPATGTFVVDTATGTPPQSMLQGSGSTAPRLALPASIEFLYTLGSEPTLFQLTLSNTGLSPLEINSITISGAPFTLQNPCPSELAAGASCVLILGYSTATTGQFTGTLTVTTNAQGGSRAITLNGLTQLKPVPVLDVSPSQMGYGSRAFGSVSADQTVTIKNIGGADARIDALITSADFVVLNHNCTTLAPLAFCEADIAMRATAYGQRRGTLTITSNADKSPHSVVLIGTSCRTSGHVLGRLGLTSGCAP